MAQNIQSKILTILKKLRNLPIGRQSIKVLIEEAKAMRISYSQFGEDLVVRKHLWHVATSDGLYIDVGAFHPIHLSNTLLLSRIGWRGVNVDCDPDKIARFEKIRPSDQNVCAGVSDSPREMNWLQYPISETNRLAELTEKDLVSACGEQPIKVIKTKVMTLTEILDRSKFRNQRFQYLNIDCEGHDLAVLKGLDFTRYSPELITVEALTASAQAELTAFLQPLGYQLTDMVRLTLFFKKAAA